MKQLFGAICLIVLVGGFVYILDHSFTIVRASTAIMALMLVIGLLFISRKF